MGKVGDYRAQKRTALCGLRFEDRFAAAPLEVSGYELLPPTLRPAGPLLQPNTAERYALIRIAPLR